MGPDRQELEFVVKEATQIVFRRLTRADFYNIYKPRGSEPKGGGQTYIDFPTSAILAVDWKKFFHGEKTLTSRSGPYWRFKLNSIGVGKSQVVEVGQRRPQSFNIRKQTLGRKHSNRVLAWHPKYSKFPEPKDSTKRVGVPNLVVYLMRTSDGEFWAGWFQTAKPEASWQVDPRLKPMFTEGDGNIHLNPGIVFDPADPEWPFRRVVVATAAEPADLLPGIALPVTPELRAKGPGKKRPPPYKQKTEDEILAEMFADDLSVEAEAEKRQIVVTVQRRNLKIVAALKMLYGGECQLTGRKFVFKKANGELYCEAHHLIPLGEGGADSPYNLIIVSPLIHRMLHYAEVTGLDLKKIINNRLEIEINGKPFAITWHPRHAELVSSPRRSTGTLSKT